MKKKYRKVYVDVIARHDKNGEVFPLSLRYEDGVCYTIDRLLDRKRASATKVGGTGIRYFVRIRGNETYLFEDDGRWFVEAKAQ